MQRLLDALLSPDPDVREGHAAFTAALQQAPLDLPSPGLARIGNATSLVFGPSLRRLRDFGRPTWDAVRVLEAALIQRLNVLVIDDDLDGATVEWLASLPEQDASPVEQVWLTR